MKILLTIFISCCVLMGCIQQNSSENNSYQDSATTTLDTIATLKETAQEEKFNSSTMPMIEDVILFPSRYRLTEDTELKDLLASKSWLEIYKKNGVYHIENATYSLSKITEDPCSGSAAQQIGSPNEALLFFAIPAIQQGKIDTVAFNENTIIPNKPFSFEFNGKSYTLKASGVTFYSQNGSTPKGTYVLRLYSDKHPEGLPLIQQDSYNDTSTELIMIADFDKDGLPDFIFSSPRDYEEERFLIILSSDNTSYEGNRQFDC